MVSGKSLQGFMSGGQPGHLTAAAKGRGENREASLVADERSREEQPNIGRRSATVILLGGGPLLTAMIAAMIRANRSERRQMERRREESIARGCVPVPGPATALLPSPSTVAVLSLLSLLSLPSPPATAPLMLPVTSALLWLPQVAVAVLPLPIMVAVLGSIR